MRIQSAGSLAFFVICIFSEPGFAATAEKGKNERVVKDGMLVSFEFTLKSPDGKLLETNKGREPLKYIHGQKKMIPGLERELTGMKVGDTKHVVVKPEDGFGKIDPTAVKELPKSEIPPDGMKVGAVLATKTPDGKIVPMTVLEIKEKTVVVDMNDPMAGKTLVFDVKIVDIQQAPPPSSQPNLPATPAKPSTPPQPTKPADPAQKK
jgi:FKBP-type peptidyl-prolyl cis-trans isomerase SlyD